MTGPEPPGCSAEEAELGEAIERVLASPSRKKLVVAGPGTGKTTLFKRLLEVAPGERDERIVLTFINNLKDDLEDDLGGLAQVYTLHSYCLGLLHQHAALRGSLTEDFECRPGLAGLIAEDFEVFRGTRAPRFVGDMRALAGGSDYQFYLDRGAYYDAVDFDDAVFRAYRGLSVGLASADTFGLVLIDEYQDFNALEAGVIDVLAESSPILIAGDDDQALYSQLRDASWDHIRLLRNAGDYEVHMLPFCMRCPEVIVDAVNDVIARANESDRLAGRIDKPYKHFPPVKGRDSAKYPFIDNVETSVQRQSANYMGRYVAEAIAQIPLEEIRASRDSRFPSALIIAAQPYRDQIVRYIEDAGYDIDKTRDTGTRLCRVAGLALLKANSLSNLGWRIVLWADRPPFFNEGIAATSDNQTPLATAIPTAFRDRIVAEAEAYLPPAEPETSEETAEKEDVRPVIKVTSYEGAKGLSAQHVYLVGLHDGELPHDPQSIKDLEICKFIVGLTRTRKKCSLLHTRNFAGNWRAQSSLIGWIDPARLASLKVDAEFWRRRTAAEADE